MHNLFAARMGKVHNAFLDEILRVTENPATISFGGGIPNGELFPVREIAEAASHVLAEDGATSLQYTTSQGYLPLREWIAEQYRRESGLDADPSEILVTNGSQQALDLIGKLFLDPGDRVAIERPGYHGAIGALALYEPAFVQISLLEDGPDPTVLEDSLAGDSVKLFYAVPNFQNPSSYTWSLEKRKAAAEILARRGELLVEDDPYGRLRFEGEHLPPIKRFLPDNTILLGTVSKTVVPGLRLGWSYARRDITERLTYLKQVADFHSDFLAQRILHRYLMDNDHAAHVEMLCDFYHRQRDLMLALIEKYVPAGVRHTTPEGGMFIWMTLPEGVSSLDLFELAARENVAFVPGRAFHLDPGGDNTLRLSYSTAGAATMEEGMKRLGAAMEQLLSNRGILTGSR